ncbi:MAG: hypothetical protein AB8G15_11250 [Saprospiraceae bacterium]
MNKAYYHKTNSRSQKLRTELARASTPFHFPLRNLLHRKEDLVLRSHEELSTTLANLSTAISSYAKQLNAADALPVLVQAVTDFYYQKEGKSKSNNVGLALKSSCTFIFQNVWGTPLKQENTLKDIVQLVNAVLLYESLHSMYIFYHFVGNIKLTISPRDIRTPSRYQYLNQEVLRLTSKTNSFRTIKDVFKIIWNDLRGFEEKVLAVLTLRRNEIEFFQGTIFEAIPASCTAFWLGVYLRLLLYRRLMSQASQLRQTEDIAALMGIQIFQEFQITLSEIAPPEVIANCVKSLFWDKNLPLDGLFNERGNLLAHRPIIRVSCEPLCFVSSPYLLMDALHTFIEASVMNYKISTAATLPPIIFEKYIATAFEERILDLFQKTCDQVGSVSAKAVWKVDKQFIKLSEEKSPGQIDVLGVVEEEKLIYVVEAKVLKDPFSFNAFRNVVQKVGRADDANFHAKLAKKMSWLKANAPQFAGYQMIGILVLDKYVPLCWQADHVVLDIEQLESLITQHRLADYCTKNALPPQK